MRYCESRRENIEDCIPSLHLEEAFAAPTDVKDSFPVQETHS